MYRKNVVIVTLTIHLYNGSDIHLHALLGEGNFMKAVHMCGPPMKWSAIAESWRNTAVGGNHLQDNKRSQTRRPQ
jgi:hypothetical protein